MSYDPIGLDVGGCWCPEEIRVSRINIIISQLRLVSFTNTCLQSEANAC